MKMFHVKHRAASENASIRDVPFDPHPLWKTRPPIQPADATEARKPS